MVGAAHAVRDRRRRGPQAVLHRRRRRRAARRCRHRRAIRGRGNRATRCSSTTASTSRTPTSTATRSTRTRPSTRSSASTACRCTRNADKNFARSGLLSGGTPRGAFAGKMIVVQNAHDAACWPNAAISYRRAVERNLGDALGDHYRLWFNEHAAHLPASFNPVGEPPVPTTRLIDYGGSLEQALRDLMDVGRGRHPTAGRDRLHARRRSAAHARAVGRRARRRATGRAGIGQRSRPRRRRRWASRSRSQSTPIRRPAAARSSESSGTSTARARSRSRTMRVDGSRASVRFETMHAFDSAGHLLPVACASPRTETVTSTRHTADW